MMEYCERNNVPYTDSKQDLVIELAKIIYGISCFLLPDQKDADSRRPPVWRFLPRIRRGRSV